MTQATKETQAAMMDTGGIVRDCSLSQICLGLSVSHLVKVGEDDFETENCRMRNHPCEELCAIL